MVNWTILWYNFKEKPHLTNVRWGFEVTPTEFSNRFNRACVIATKKGWIKDYTWLDKKRIAHNKKWDYDSVREEAKKSI